MTLLGCGILGISLKKNWHLLNYLGFLCTYGLFFGSMKDYQLAEFWNVMPFLVGFFVLYSTALFLFNVVQRTKSTMLELIGLLLNAGIFFAASYQLVSEAYGQRAVAAITLGLTAFYAAHVYYFLVRRIADRELMLSFMGLAAFFLAVTIPLVLSREWITVSWAIQALVMLWLADKLNSQFLRQVAYLLYGIVLLRFGFMDLPAQYSGALPQAAEMPLRDYLMHLVERLVVFGVPIASMAGAYFLLKTPQASARLAVDQANDVAQWVRTPWAVRCSVILVLGMAFLYPSPRAEPHTGLSVRSRPLADSHTALAGDVLAALERIPGQPQPAGAGRSGALHRWCAGQAGVLRLALLGAGRGLGVRGRLFLGGCPDAAARLRGDCGLLRPGVLPARRRAWLAPRGQIGWLAGTGTGVRVPDTGAEHVLISVRACAAARRHLDPLVPVRPGFDHSRNLQERRSPAVHRARALYRGWLQSLLLRPGQPGSVLSHRRFHLPGHSHTDCCVSVPQVPADIRENNGVSGLGSHAMTVRFAVMLCLGLSVSATAADGEPILRYRKDLDRAAATVEEILGVPLDSDIYAATRDGYPDLRIVDDRGAQVPYVLEPAGERRTIQVREPCNSRVLSLHVDEGKALEIVVALDEKAPSASGATIRTPLVDYEHRVQVFGSRDGKDWTLLASDRVIL